MELLGLTVDRTGQLGLLVYRSPELVHRILWAVQEAGEVRFVPLIAEVASGDRWAEKTISNTILDLEKVGALRIVGKGRGWKTPTDRLDERRVTVSWLGEAWLGFRPWPPLPSEHDGWRFDDDDDREFLS